MNLIIPVQNGGQALELIDMIKSHGLIIDQDFSWQFVPNKYDGYDLLSSTQPIAEIMFDDPKWATYFQLRWAK